MLSEPKYLICFETKISECPVNTFLSWYKHVIEKPHGIIIITLVREPWNWTDFNDWANSIKNYIDNKGHTVYFLVNSTFNYDYVCNDLKKSIFAIDFFLTDTVFRFKFDCTIKINPNWNLNSKKGLFLSGKPEYYNRYKPILYLDEKNRLKDFTYSYHGTEIEDLRDLDLFYPENLDIVSKLKSLSNSLDIEFKNHHYSGYPYDPSLYKNTTFSLIPEGVIDYHNSNRVNKEFFKKNKNYFYNDLDNPFITEKTYRSILNYHPFIILGQLNSNIYLEKLGFKTFREYLKYPNYNEIVNLEDRICLGIENSIYFLDNYQKYKDEINKDVVHNFNNLIAIAKTQWQSIPFFNDPIFLRQTYELCSFDLDTNNISKEVLTKT